MLSVGQAQLNIRSLFINVESEASIDRTVRWAAFLEKNKFDFSWIAKIDMSNDVPVIFDKLNNKFSIDFVRNKKNYAKAKTSIKTELISKSLGAGKRGLRLLDLSAGLGIDAVFLAQLGYSVIGLERNPLIYLALNEALLQKATNGLAPKKTGLKFVFAEALNYLKEIEIKEDIIYFDPMFPEKIKSALPRQEMVFFRNLVGDDEDATEVLAAALRVRGIKRVVVKRPIKAPALLAPTASIKGKLVRFDLYGV